VYYIVEYMNQDSSVGMARGYGLDCRGSSTGSEKYFSLLHSVQTVSEAHPASNLMGTGGSFSGDKAAGA
jgi:hypothetical protein